MKGARKLRIWALNLIAIAFVASLVYGCVFSRFIPTPLGIKAGFSAALLMAIIFTVLTFAAPPSSRNGRPDDLAPYRVVGFLIGGFVMGMYIFTFVFAEGYTAFFGAMNYQLAVVTEWNNASKRDCAGPRIPAGFLVPQRSICAPASAKDALPVGTVIRLQGVGTRLGLIVEAYSLDTELPDDSN